MSRRIADTAFVAVACAALLLCGGVHPGIPVLCLVALAVKAFVLDASGARVPAPVLAFLSALLLAAFLWLSLLRQPPLEFLRLLLTFGVPFLLFRSVSRPTQFNHFLIFLVSLMIVVGCAAVATGLTPVLITGLYLFVACQALPVLTARRETRDSGIRIRMVGPRRARGTGVAVWVVHHLALFGLVLGALLYLVVPRLSEDAPEEKGASEARLHAGSGGGRTSASRTTSAQSGFPKEVRIGDIGRIKRRGGLVLRARLLAYGRPYDPERGERSMLLLRARAWERYAPGSRRWVESRGGLRPLGREGILERGDTPVHWSFEVFGYDSRVLFMPQRPRIVRSAVRPLFVDGLGIVTARRRVPEYQVEAAWPPRTRAELAFLEPDRSDPDLLRVPREIRSGLRAHLPSRRVPGLATSAAAIDAFFARGFTYTLDLPATLSAEKDPILAFLERKEGHCELFASAACLFLRLHGVPARLAGGLRCSEQTGPGEYQARFFNAHAWVEIPCRGVGWVAIDFTPPDVSAAEGFSASGGGEEEEPVAEAGGPGAGGGLDWRDPFRYGPEDQQRVVAWMSDHAVQPLVGGIGAALLALFCGYAVLALRRRRRADPLRISAPPGVTRKTLAFYAQWLRACAAQGHVRRHSQTPREFLATLPADLRTQGARVTAEFERKRYGS